MQGPANGIARALTPPPTPDALTIDGVAIDLKAENVWFDRLLSFARGGPPELHFRTNRRTPGALPDPWNLKSCTLTMQGQLMFSGTVQGYVDSYDGDTGWNREYRAFGLIYSGNYVPVTDSVTLTDTSTFNLPGDDVNQIGSRTGLTVGQIVGEILTMAENAVPLSNAGIGNYSLSPILTYLLPAATLADLATLAVIPLEPARIIGERILPALEQFVQSWHPNHYMYVDVYGTIRFVDPRQGTNYTITLNDPADPRWQLPQLTRDATDNYSQIHVRGNTRVAAFTLQDKPWAGSGTGVVDGGLGEYFDHDGLTNAQAKAAWKPTDWSQPNSNGIPMDVGPCTVVDTLHVTITSTRVFTANQLGQGSGELLGWINLRADTLGGDISQYWLAKIVGNDATVTQGTPPVHTTKLMVDSPLPSLTYNAYQLFGIAAGANVVGRRYRVTNHAVAQRLQNFFPYPVPYIYANGSAAEMTSSNTGTVFYNATGSGPPYTSSTVGLTVDPEAGLIYFNTPVQVVVGGYIQPTRWPAVVQAMVAVAIGTLDAYAPHATNPTDITQPGGYAGTLYTVEGVARTKTITVLAWKDIGNNASMALYAAEMLDSLKDVVIEGELPYAGLPDLGWLTPNRTVSIAGHGFTTGWESIALPVVSAEVTFQTGPSGTSYATRLQLSNRRQAYDSSNFLKPAIQGISIGGPEGGFGAGAPEFAGYTGWAGAAAYQGDVGAAMAQMEDIASFVGGGIGPAGKTSRMDTARASKEAREAMFGEDVRTSRADTARASKEAREAMFGTDVGTSRMDTARASKEAREAMFGPDVRYVRAERPPQGRRGVQAPLGEPLGGGD